MKKLILASSSRQRRELLELLRVPFEVVPSSFEENNSLGMAPEELVTHLALGKAQEVASRNPEAVVIGADCLVFVDGKVCGKPENDEHHFDMLSSESGRRQLILTGMAIIGDGRTVTDVTRTDVDWRELSDEEFRAYIAGGEGRGRAGGYSIAGQGSIFVERIEGDFNSAIGMSTFALAKRLREFGFKVL